MDWILQILMVGVGLSFIWQIRRRDKALGIETNWRKAVVTVVAILVLVVATTGVMYVLFDRGWMIVTFVVSLLFFFGGLAGIVVVVNRLWPAKRTGQ